MFIMDHQCTIQSAYSHHSVSQVWRFHRSSISCYGSCWSVNLAIRAKKSLKWSCRSVASTNHKANHFCFHSNFCSDGCSHVSWWWQNHIDDSVRETGLNPCYVYYWFISTINIKFRTTNIHVDINMNKIILNIKWLL